MGQEKGILSSNSFICQTVDIWRIVPPKPNCRYLILKLVLDQQIYRFGQNPEKIVYHNINEGLIITTMLGDCRKTLKLGV